MGADIGTLGKCLFPRAKALSSGLDCKAVSKSNTLRIDTCHAHMLFKRLGLGTAKACVCPTATLPPPRAFLKRWATTPGLYICFSKQCLLCGLISQPRTLPSTLQYFKQKLAIK